MRTLLFNSVILGMMVSCFAAMEPSDPKSETPEKPLTPTNTGA